MQGGGVGGGGGCATGGKPSWLTELGDDKHEGGHVKEKFRGGIGVTLMLSPWPSTIDHAPS